MSGLGQQLADLASGDMTAVRHDDDVVAQALDLLHDVGRTTMHFASSGIAAQPAQAFAKARVATTSSPLVGSSSRMLSRVVHDGPGQGGLHALTLAEAIRPPVHQRLKVEHLGQRRCHSCAVSSAMPAKQAVMN